MFLNGGRRNVQKTLLILLIASLVIILVSNTSYRTSNNFWRLSTPPSLHQFISWPDQSDWLANRLRLGNQQTNISPSTASIHSLPWSTVHSYSNTTGFGVFHNLYYFNDRFYLLTKEEADSSQPDSITVDRLNQFVHPHYDFCFSILSYSLNNNNNCSAARDDLPWIAANDSGDGDLQIMAETTWMALSPRKMPEIIDHYFYFMKLLLGLWSEQWMYLRKTKLPDATDIDFDNNDNLSFVKQMIIGPHADWIDGNEKAIIKLILDNLLPHKPIIFDIDNPLPSNRLIRFEKVVVVERLASHDFDSVMNADKMNMARIPGSLLTKPDCFERMKQRILTHLLPDHPKFTRLSPIPSLINVFSMAGERIEVQTWKPRLTYISRQNLASDISDRLDHLLASSEMQSSFHVRTVFMEQLTSREQIQLASETDVMLGVRGHGGLTHSLWMPRGGVVVELVLQRTCLRYNQFITIVGGQRWVGVDAEGVLTIGVERFCGSNEDEESMRANLNRVRIDVDNSLRHVLLAIRNMLDDRNPLGA